MKEYTREYYDRWYRDPEARIASAEGTARKVRLAVATAEFMLARKIESVLDVGCGEAPWRAPLRKLRPNASYIGVESSEYVVGKYGKSRNIRLGTFARVGALELEGPFDLIVCADVVQYIPDDDLQRGLRGIRRLAGGVVYIETFAAEDAMEGDRDGWIDQRKIRNANRFEIATGP